MNSPKYARSEHERRFIVRAGACPDLTERPFRLIADRYLDDTRLRLRTMMSSTGGEPVFKLCKKYPPADPTGGPIVNVYLTADEHALVSLLPGAPLLKRRFDLEHDGRLFALDLFLGALDGLILLEGSSDTREAVRDLAPPPWVGDEVTADPFFTGAALARATPAALAERLDALNATRH